MKLQSELDNTIERIKSFGVQEILEYKEPNKAIAKHIEEDDRTKHPITDSSERIQQMWMINESGLYSLIFGSKMKEAKKFKKWVTSEVLPMIRKTGMYMTDNIWEQLSVDPTKFGELLIEYGKTKKE